MVRSRSRSPKRRDRTDRRRSRSRDRDRRRHRRSRSRDRHRSPPRRRSRSRSRSPRRRDREHERDRDRDRGGPSHRVSRSESPQQIEKPNISEADLVGKTEDEVEMMKTMGFCGFETTQGKQVTGNNISESNITQKRKYRQYMNRRGGFNRPLDFVA